MSLAKLLISSGLADFAPACGGVQTARIPALPPHHGQRVSGEQESESYVITNGARWIWVAGIRAMGAALLAPDGIL